MYVKELTDQQDSPQSNFPPDAVVRGGGVVANTMVLMKDDSITPIQNIGIGDHVPALFGPRTVISTGGYGKELRNHQDSQQSNSQAINAWHDNETLHSLEEFLAMTVEDCEYWISNH